MTKVKTQLSLINTNIDCHKQRYISYFDT